MAAFDKYIANQLNQWNKVVVEDDRHAFEFTANMPYIFTTPHSVDYPYDFRLVWQRFWDIAIGSFSTLID